LNEIEVVFRNPNLLIESIKEMQSKQEESLRDIQIKLDEMTKIKDNLKSRNAFRPKFIFIQPKRRDAFIWFTQIRRMLVKCKFI